MEKKGRIRNEKEPGSKYADVWSRARVKLRGFMRILRMMQEKRRDAKKNTKTFHRDLTGSLYLTQTINGPVFGDEPLLEPVPFGIIHPEGKPKLIWNLIMAILLIYTAIVMPYTLVFVDSTGFDTWSITDIILDVLFFADFVINCTTAVYDNEGKLVSKYSKILWQYLKTWMLLDIASFFPFDFISPSSNNSNYTSSDYNNFFRLFRIPKLYRLFRISRLFKLFKHYRNSEILDSIQEFLSIKHSMMKLITTSISILLCVHIFACFWYYIAKIEDCNPNTWVGSLSLQDQGNMFLYITSVYWAITTLCTVGYGDIHAVSTLEKLFSICWMVFAIYVLSFVIGSLSSMLNSIDTKENILVNKLAIIDEFSKEANLDKKLTSKLRHALKYSTEKTGFNWIDKQNLFNELPKQLRFEVSMAMHKGAAKCIDFLRDKDSVLVSSIVPFLQPIFIQAEEFIYKKGEYAEEIYFITKGRIVYTYAKTNIELQSIQLGDYFGDIEVALEVFRKCSAKAARNSELLIMNKQVIKM
jgi:hypothetical protein